MKDRFQLSRLGPVWVKHVMTDGLESELNYIFHSPYIEYSVLWYLHSVYMHIKILLK